MGRVGNFFGGGGEKTHGHTHDIHYKPSQGSFHLRPWFGNTGTRHHGHVRLRLSTDVCTFKVSVSSSCIPVEVDVDAWLKHLSALTSLTGDRPMTSDVDCASRTLTKNETFYCCPWERK